MPLAPPLVDPPSNGWDYQRHPPGDPTGRPGADTSPFYENDTPNPDWRFPDFGAFHTEGVDSRFEDMPSTGVGEHVIFKTFLVVVRDGANTFTAGVQDFGKLAGFSWRLDGGGFQDITALGAVDPSMEKEKINPALANSGFAGWSTIQPGDLTLVPEPAGLMGLAIALGLVMARRRRR